MINSGYGRCCICAGCGLVFIADLNKVYSMHRKMGTCLVAGCIVLNVRKLYC